MSRNEPDLSISRYQSLGLMFQMRHNPAAPAALLLVALVIVSTLLSPAFLTPTNISNLLRQSVPLAMVGLGQSVAILAGGVDLSVSSTITITAISAYMLIPTPARVLPVVLLTLGFGVVIGLINGLFITKFKTPAFMLTLGTATVVQGIGLIITNGRPRGGITPEFRTIFEQGTVLGIPNSGLWLLFFTILAVLLLERGTFGRQIFAVGGNERAARLSGINVDWVRILTYILCQVLAVATGLILAARQGICDNWIGLGYDLKSVAVAVIGGCAFGGGKGTAVGAVIGAFVFMVIQNILNLMGVDPFVTQIVVGAVIVGAVAGFVSKR